MDRQGLNKNILAIETSCDETAAAVLRIKSNPSTRTVGSVRGSNSSILPKAHLTYPLNSFPRIKTLASVVRSQISIHKSFGGVVPEAAARAHVKWIRPVVKQALHASNFTLHDIDYIAVTVGPGLIPSLMVSVEFAKALSFATGKPMIPVNHMLGHLYSPFGEPNPKSKILNPKSVFPMISLIVSGGHTILVLMKSTKEYKVLGQTLDDAAGEAFDKVAKMLSLPYPGGPEVSKLALQGNPNAINFPRPMLTHRNYNFSFSGLKTAVLYYLKDLNAKRYTLHAKKDVCASFQQAVVDVLVTKTLRAAKEFDARSISLSGGVAANTSLREKLKVESKKLKIKFLPSPLHLTGDNAEMIGLAAGFMLQNGFKPVNHKKVKANSNLQL